MKPTYEELEATVKKLKIDADCYKKGMEASNARLVQLAAENAYMQQVIGDVQTLYYESDGIVGYHLNGDIAKWDDVMPDLWSETPATEAFLAEVRASAIDSIVDIKTKQLTDMHPDTHAFGATAMSIRSQINELQAFAAQLRKGGAE